MRMRKRMLKRSQLIYIWPPARSVLAGYDLPQRNDIWRAEPSSCPRHVLLTNITTDHRKDLPFNLIRSFDERAARTIQGARVAGRLNVKAQLYLSGARMWWE